MAAPYAPYVLLDDQVSHRQLYFTQPHDILTYRAGEPVRHFLDAIDQAHAAGYWVAGQFNYEFGLMLEPRLMGRVAAGQILARVGLFGEPSNHPPVTHLYRAAPPALRLTPDWTDEQYRRRFDKVQAFLRAGDVYQINLTFPMRGKTEASAADIYAGFRGRQPGRYGGIVSLDPNGPDIISFSPELFFARQGQSVRMRPMKGTRARTATDDMRHDEKSQAENLMIVDLLRNDLSRLCGPGTVKVPELFAIEDYPTLTQMTSQITGELRDGVVWADIFPALFPCGSVTGAPKIRAMEIIHDLESGPRGPYCGTIGYIAPDGRAAFSVAIRTAVLESGTLRYDVGSGVVLDSDGADEYRECLLKADILNAWKPTRFETLRTGPNGPVRADAHAKRFGRPLPDIPVTATNHRVRIDRDEDDNVSVQITPLQAIKPPLKLVVSRYAISDDVQRTDIKTSRRDFYDGERARLSTLHGVDEVLFCNREGHLTEGSFTTLFVEKGGTLLTPSGPGLLPGVLRAEMLSQKKAMTAMLTLNDLLSADQIWVGNSLRGLMRATLISSERL